LANKAKKNRNTFVKLIDSSVDPSQSLGVQDRVPKNIGTGLVW